MMLTNEPSSELYLRGLSSIRETGKRKGGRYGWVATVTIRWRDFCRFCAASNVLEPSAVNHKVVEDYAASLSGNAASTAQNKLSAVNKVMSILTKHQWSPVSPKKLAGRRRVSVRNRPVEAYEKNVQAVIDDLIVAGHDEMAAVVWLCYRFGLRRREVMLLDVHQALKEGRCEGQISITRGTKGGRSRYSARVVPCCAKGLEALVFACRVCADRECLIPSNKRLIDFSQCISYRCLSALKAHGISRLHELRVAYANERYQAISGGDAPCSKIDVPVKVSEVDDVKARMCIAQELGHSRLQIASAYIGRKARRSSSNE